MVFMPDAASNNPAAIPKGSIQQQAVAFGLPLVNLSGRQVPADILNIIPENVARENQLAVYEKNGKVLKIAIGEPNKLQQKAPDFLLDLKRQGYEFGLAIASAADLDYLLGQYRQTPIKTQAAVNQPVAPSVNLRNISLKQDVLNKFPKEVAEKYKMICFAAPSENSVKVGLVDPKNPQAKEILAFIKKRNDINIETHKISEEDFRYALGLYTGPIATPSVVKTAEVKKTISPTIKQPQPVVRPKPAKTPIVKPAPTIPASDEINQKALFLSDKEFKLTQKEEELNKSQKELDGLRLELKNQEIQIRSSETNLKQLNDKLNQDKTRFAQDQGLLQKQQLRLTQQQNELEERKKSLEQEKSQLEQTQKQLQEETGKIQVVREQLINEQKNAQEQKSQLNNEKAVLAGKEQALHERQNQFTIRLEALDQASRDLVNQRHRLNSMQVEAEKKSKLLAQKEKELTAKEEKAKEAYELMKYLENEKEEIKQQRSSLSQLQEEIKTKMLEKDELAKDVDNFQSREVQIKEQEQALLKKEKSLQLKEEQIEEQRKEIEQQQLSDQQKEGTSRREEPAPVAVKAQKVKELPATSTTPKAEKSERPWWQINVREIPNILGIADTEKNKKVEQADGQDNIFKPIEAPFWHEESSTEQPEPVISEVRKEVALESAHQAQASAVTPTKPDQKSSSGKQVPVDVATAGEKSAEFSEENILDNFFPEGLKTKKELEKIVKSGAIPKIIAGILCLANKFNASDIHLEPLERTFRLRYRIDGLLKDILELPMTLHPAIVSRVKILSRLKIDETRIPQDGRFTVKVAQKDIDIRVSTFPTAHGEKVELRILDKSAALIKLEDLGLEGVNLTRIQEAISRPHGIILSTGPTGSGKTTTLYSILNKLSKPTVNIVTLEDPVEYDIAGVNQCQVNPKIGFGFAEGLRSILRQDPNIIMVGEIRDKETAELTTHAALTGHLVLSTLHTNDAAGALPRLIDMGIEPFLITSSINAIIAQRLVRHLCPKCKIEAKVPSAMLENIKKQIVDSVSPDLAKWKNKPLKFYTAKGCSECEDGYRGRLGLFEVLVMSPKIEELTVGHKPASELFEAAHQEGMLSLREDGIIKVLAGKTSLDEVFRATEE